MSTNNLTLARKAINHIIRYWNAEGDYAPAAELFEDAILHLRWRMEEFKQTLEQACHATLKMRS